MLLLLNNLFRVPDIIKAMYKMFRLFGGKKGFVYVWLIRSRKRYKIEII